MSAVGNPHHLQPSTKFVADLLSNCVSGSKLMLEQDVPPLEPACRLPVWNLQVLQDMVGDDEVLINELLLEFSASASRQGQRLCAAWEARDAQAVAAEAHKLKSAARAVGAQVLGEACAALEGADLLGEQVWTPWLRDQFVEALAVALRRIQAHLG
jgi:two-component system, sensor histidine kinase and response regulator